MPKDGQPRYGYFRIMTVTSSTSVYDMETRPNKQSNRCSRATLVSSILIHLSPFFINREGSVKITKEGSENNYCDPIMAKPSMVHQSVVVICTQPDFTSPHTRFIVGPNGEYPSTISKCLSASTILCINKWKNDKFTGK